MRDLYTVASDGIIKYAGGIQGPLTTPTQLPLDTVVTMVRKGYEVYQHNPVNLSEKVLVTVKNVGNISFSSTKAQTVTRRALNKSIQDLEKPMTANVNRKADNKKYDKYNNRNDAKTSETTVKDNSAEEKTESSSVIVPDAFSKN